MQRTKTVELNEVILDQYGRMSLEMLKGYLFGIMQEIFMGLDFTKKRLANEANVRMALSHEAAELEHELKDASFPLKVATTFLSCRDRLVITQVVRDRYDHTVAEVTRKIYYHEIDGGTRTILPDNLWKLLY